ncbi:hypothetical protein GCM10009037_30710 [Halarchaeum grantii]|uniref:Uncharacterized protein n=1 Tax=Halarchaeum grantii TaxID=1193105 RepID=A0A830FDT6_9EURY|nr:hypothetical protein GCM10009037_30710 [Halarchaeum grantii]
MGLGWDDLSDDPWELPISKPKATSWVDLIQHLNGAGPRETKPSELRRRHKEKYGSVMAISAKGRVVRQDSTTPHL